MIRFLLRPIYRAFLKKPLRWGLTRLRAFFLADIAARLQSVEALSTQLRDAEANLAAQLHNLRAELVPYLQRGEMNLNGLPLQLAERFCALEANNAAQWDGIEQLLLAMFRLPQSQESTPNDARYLKAIDLNQVHAAGNLR